MFNILNIFFVVYLQIKIKLSYAIQDVDYYEIKKKRYDLKSLGKISLNAHKYRNI